MTFLKELTYKKQLEEFVEKIQETLFDPVDAEYLDECKSNLHPTHYLEVVEERYCRDLCGYPICQNKIPKKKLPKYRINRKVMQIVDMSELKFYCSEKCLINSKLYLSQLSDEPIILRKNKQKTNEQRIHEMFENLKIEGGEKKSTVSEQSKKILNQQLPKESRKDTMSGIVEHTNTQSDQILQSNLETHQIKELGNDHKQQKDEIKIEIEKTNGKVNKNQKEKCQESDTEKVKDQEKNKKEQVKGKEKKNEIVKEIDTEKVKDKEKKKVKEKEKEKEKKKDQFEEFPEFPEFSGYQFKSYPEISLDSMSDDNFKKNQNQEEEEKKKKKKPKKKLRFQRSNGNSMEKQKTKSVYETPQYNPYNELFDLEDITREDLDNELSEFGSLMNEFTSWVTNKTERFMKALIQNRINHNSIENQKDIEIEIENPFDEIEKTKKKLFFQVIKRRITKINSLFNLEIVPSQIKLQELIDTFNLIRSISDFDIREWTIITITIILSLSKCKKFQYIRSVLSNNNNQIYNQLLEYCEIKNDEMNALVDVISCGF
ncbi:hypothetical protein M0813_10757 [Anaeramoeba flamelloides]|uniref:RNA polymerase II subunit B1 CTD phosphatase RPAP2 homolog n=1 Tax=Anaeramoeba flamelloides TaxID=1746091 RepID=A0ABQ8X243_9EUKA|nr:hypothetical protein M0813_10757 [Anaeramoeba flamelloides]